MAPIRRSARAEHWQRIVDRFHASGLSVAQFSKKHGISAQSLYQWRRKLLPKADGGFTTKTTTARLLPVHIVPSVATNRLDNSQTDRAQLHIRTPSGFVIRCGSSLPVSQVAELVRAIESNHQEGKRPC
jgi:transposase-like protein